MTIKSKLVRFAIVFVTCTILFYSGIFGCGGKGGPAAPTVTGPTVTLETLRNLVVDQFIFYTDSEIREPDIEVWIEDASTGEIVLCAYNGLGMGAVQTETVIYGNVNAGFKVVTGNNNYEGSIFRLHIKQNGLESCVDDEGNVIGKTDDFELGASEVINFPTMTTEPIIGENGSFYIRLRDENDETFPVPLALTNMLSSDTLNIDQVYWSEGVDSGDNDNAFDTEVYVIDTDTDEMIACSGIAHGLAAVRDDDVIYGKLFSDFVDEDANIVDFDEHTGKNVKLVLIDNDGNACPDSITTDGARGGQIDDIMGESEVMLWDDLPGSKVNIIDEADNNNAYIIFNSH